MRTPNKTLPRRSQVRSQLAALVACAARHGASALALHDFALQSLFLCIGVVWSSARWNVAPAVATAEAGITSCLACCSALSTSCCPNRARRPVRLAARDGTRILVDAIIVGNPGAVAAICGALCHGRVARVRQTSEAGCCGSQRCKRDRIEAQAREHGSSSGWASRNLSKDLALQPHHQNDRRVL